MLSMARRLPILCLFVVFAAGPALAADKPKLHKLDRVLHRAATQAPEPQRVIIRAGPGGRGALRAALTAHGDVVEAEHPMLDALTAYVHGEDLVALANDPSVLSVSCDCEVSPSGGTSSRSRRGSQWKPSEIRQLLGLDQAAAEGYVAKGAGVGVGIVDSGLEHSRDFAGRVGGFWDYTRGGGETSPYDDYGHGTHIAGLIGSSGVLSNGQYQGVAPEVRLFIFKVLDKRGRGRTSTVIRALEYITANHQHLGIDVVNLSLGHLIQEPAATDPLVQAVEATVRAGLVVVVSAGNNGTRWRSGETGYGGINSPGNAPSAITVGAAETRRTIARVDDRVADFSSRGPTWYDGDAKPDVVAPGVDLVSNLPRRSTLGHYSDLRVGSSFGELSGTSMASAVTTGLVALVLEQNGHNIGEGYGTKPLTTNAVKAIVEYTATPLHSAAPPTDLNRYDYLTQGTGEVNGEGAVRLTSSIDTSIGLGEYWTIAGLQPFTDFGAEQDLWSQNIVWGNFVVGNEVALYSSAAWDDNIVWGTEFERDGENIVWGTVELVGGFDGGDNIVWGTLDFDDRSDNIVWGTEYIEEWADNIVWGNWLLGYQDGDNIVWGTQRGDDNIVWGNVAEDNIVWGTLFYVGNDNIVWGNSR